MVWFGFQFGAGLALFGLLLAFLAWIGTFAIDAIDSWSSQITMAEARRRARLATSHRAAALDARRWTRGQVVALIAGLLILLAFQTARLP